MRLYSTGSATSSCLKRGFQASSGAAEWHRSSYGTDFDSSEIASPVQGLVVSYLPKEMPLGWMILGSRKLGACDPSRRGGPSFAWRLRRADSENAYIDLDHKNVLLLRASRCLTVLTCWYLGFITASVLTRWHLRFITG